MRSYSEEEDKIILAEISRMSINLKVAFERASERLGDRSADSVSKRWYNVLSLKETVFASVSSFGVATNRKSAPRKRDRRGELRDDVLELAFPGTTKRRKMQILEMIVGQRR